MTQLRVGDYVKVRCRKCGRPFTWHFKAEGDNVPEVCRRNSCRNRGDLAAQERRRQVRRTLESVPVGGETARLMAEKPRGELYR